MSQLRFRHEYPALTARRYGVNIPRRDNSMLIDPIEFALAQIYLKPRSELEEMVEDWNPKHSPVKEGLIKRSGKKARTADLSTVEKGDIMQSIKSGIKKVEGSTKLWYYGSPNTAVKSIRLIDRRKLLMPFAGGQILSGEVASRKKGFRPAYIAGPYESSRIYFAGTGSGTHDSFFTQQKLGFHEINHTDFTSALLMTYASLFPDKVKNKYDNRQIELPFAYSGQDLADALIAKYVAGWNNARVSQELLKNISISHRLKGMVNERKANFGVILNKHPSNLYSPTVKKFLGSIHHILLDSEFRKHGYVIEYAGTGQQAVAEDYRMFTKENGTQYMHMARIYTNDAPPLLIFRKKKIPFSPHIRDDSTSGPWDDIYRTRAAIDDSTGQSTRFEVRLPIGPDMKLEAGILSDYRTALNKLVTDKNSFLRRVNKKIRGNKFYYAVRNLLK